MHHTGRQNSVFHYLLRQRWSFSWPVHGTRESRSLFLTNQNIAAHPEVCRHEKVAYTLSLKTCVLSCRAQVLRSVSSIQPTSEVLGVPAMEDGFHNYSQICIQLPCPWQQPRDIKSAERNGKWGQCGGPSANHKVQRRWQQQQLLVA